MKNVFALLAAMLFAWGCTDNSYKGDFEDNKGASYSLPVKVAVGGPSVKGGYAIGGFEDMTGKNIHVYAFRKSSKASYKVTSAEDQSVCLIDASSDKAGETGGKTARLTGTDFYASWTGKGVNWPSGDRHRDAYDFFAYFIDDAEVSEVVREDDKVEVRLEIDGSQDIMLSKAALTASQLAGLNASDKEEASALSYSHFTALRYICPVFTFRHQLVRLDFEPLPEGVDGVSVLSCRKAVLTVAHKDGAATGISFTDNVDSMGGTAAEEYALKVSGNTLLAAPADRYRVYVTIDGKTQQCEILNPEAGRRFMSGERYSVRLTVDADGIVGAEVSQAV